MGLPCLGLSRSVCPSLPLGHHISTDLSLSLFWPLLLPGHPIYFHRITESRNVRGWQGPLWVTQSNPLPKQGHPEQAAQHHVQVGLEYLQRRRLHSLPGQPGPGLHHPGSRICRSQECAVEASLIFFSSPQVNHYLSRPERYK